MKRKTIIVITVIIASLGLLDVWSRSIQTAQLPQQVGGATTVNLELDEAEIGELVNKERLKAGLPAIKMNSTLRASACAKADEMITLDYWSHDAPDGSDPWSFIQKAGYPYRQAGENLAFGHDSEESLVAKWMQSPTHRQNILLPFEDQGICVRVGEYQGGYYNVIVHHFGTD